jgi:hypothetical protein
MIDEDVTADIECLSASGTSPVGRGRVSHSNGTEIEPKPRLRNAPSRWVEQARWWYRSQLGGRFVGQPASLAFGFAALSDRPREAVPFRGTRHVSTFDCRPSTVPHRRSVSSPPSRNRHERHPCRPCVSTRTSRRHRPVSLPLGWAPGPGSIWHVPRTGEDHDSQLDL